MDDRRKIEITPYCLGRGCLERQGRKTLMLNPQPISFHYEFEYCQPAQAEPAPLDAKRSMRIICHGSLIAETTHHLEELRRSEAFCAHVIFDLMDVVYVDSDGLDGLIRLRLWGFLQGVYVEISNLSPQVLQLTSLPNLGNAFGC